VYSNALHSSMRDFVDVSKTVLVQIRLGAEFTAPSNIIISKAHLTTSESVTRASSTIVPNGRFSEVFPLNPSTSDTFSTVARTIAVITIFDS